MKAMIDALNVIYGEDEKRSFFASQPGVAGSHALRLAGRLWRSRFVVVFPLVLPHSASTGQRSTARRRSCAGLLLC